MIRKYRSGQDFIADLTRPRITSYNVCYTKLLRTSMGGATLYIESIPVPSNNPGFKQTGQLGKVMVESSEIAYSYVRSFRNNFV